MAARRAGRRGRRTRYLEYARASKLVFLRRYAAKLAYELELHGGERPLDEMPALYARLLGDAVGVDWPRVTLPRPTSTPATTPPTTCARGRSRRTCAGMLRERFGERVVHAAARRATCCASSGARASGSTPTSCSPQVTGEQLDFGVMLDEV